MIEGDRAAAVDIGSTSVHLLVGDRSGPAVATVLDQSELLGLGARVASAGFLGAEARIGLVTALVAYAADGRRLAASATVFVGTDPLRHAADAARACLEIERATGVPVHVLDQDEEGALTLLGLTGGAAHGDLAVIDIGGGSTEVVIAGPDGIRRIVGLPLGAARLSTVVGPTDPPTVGQFAALRREADRIVARAPDLTLGEAFAVGGTAYGVARVATGPGTGERLVDRDGIALAATIAGRERSEHVAELFGLNPRRARILPAGVAILASIAARYGIDRVRVSELGIREGLIHAVLDDPIAWRDRLARPARHAPGD